MKGSVVGAPAMMVDWMDGWIGEGPKDVKVKARSALSFLRSSKLMFEIATRKTISRTSSVPLTRYKNSAGEPNRWRTQRRAAEVNVFPRCPAVTPLLSFPLSLGPPPPLLLRSLSASKFRNPTWNLFTTDLRTDALNAAPSERRRSERRGTRVYVTECAALSLRIAGLDAAACCPSFLRARRDPSSL